MKFLPYPIKKLFRNFYTEYCFNNLFKGLEKEIKTTPAKGKDLKNILYINTLAGKGGAARIAYDGLCKGVRNKGFSSDIYVNENFAQDDKKVHLIKKLAPKEQKLLLNAQYKNSWLDFFFFQSFEISKTEVFKRADLVHFHNLHGGYFSPFAIAHLSKLKPAVWTLHDQQAFTGHCACVFDCEKWKTGCHDCPDIENYPGILNDTSAFLYEIKKKIYQNSGLTIVAPSKWLLNMVKESILGHFDIKLIYNGVNPNIFKNINKNEARDKLDLPKDKKILLFSALTGLDDPLKGGEFIKTAYEELKNDDILFICTGGKEKREINENFFEFEYIADENELALFFAASDLFIYPALTDNCPLSVLESMSCGTPVISFKTGGIPELVQHLESGYIADYKDKNDFVNGIKTLLNSEELLKKCSHQAREIVLTEFTIDLMLEKYMELYYETIEKWINR